MSNKSDYDLATLQLSALCAAADPGRRLWHERAYAARIVAHSFATTGQPLAAHNTRHASAQAIRQLRTGAQAAPVARHDDHPLYGLPSEFITAFDFYGEEIPVTVSYHFHPGQPGGLWDPPAGDAAEIIGITIGPGIEIRGALPERVLQELEQDILVFIDRAYRRAYDDACEPEYC